MLPGLRRGHLRRGPRAGGRGHRVLRPHLVLGPPGHPGHRRAHPHPAPPRPHATTLTAMALELRTRTERFFTRVSEVLFTSPLAAESLGEGRSQVDLRLLPDSLADGPPAGRAAARDAARASPRSAPRTTPTWAPSIAARWRRPLALESHPARRRPHPGVLGQHPRAHALAARRAHRRGPVAVDLPLRLGGQRRLHLGHAADRVGPRAATSATWWRAWGSPAARGTRSQVESPFDYGTQALLYVPGYLPEPSEPRVDAAVLPRGVPAARALGRARLRALHLAASTWTRCTRWWRRT